MSLYNIEQILALRPPQVRAKLSSYSGTRAGKIPNFHLPDFLKLYSSELVFPKVGKLQYKLFEFLS